MSGKGKRGPSAPLVTTSDEDEPGDQNSAPASPRARIVMPPTPSPSPPACGGSTVITDISQGTTILLNQSQEQHGVGTVVKVLPVAATTTITTTPSVSNSPPSLEHDYALPDPDHDHDYENVSSPGNSSTASGPTYVRQPGFTHHAHEVTASPTPSSPNQGATSGTTIGPGGVVTPATSPSPGPCTPHPPVGERCSLVSRSKVKKKKTTLLAVKDGLKKREPTPPKTRPKREPLPMRLRALPQSFWQQPNVPHTVSPGTAYPILPPLCAADRDDEDEMRPVTPPEEREEREERSKEKTSVKPPRIPERKIIVANTDLLFKLFEGIEKKSGSPTPAATSTSLKRGRPRKVVPCSNKSFVSGEDPYLVDCVSEKLFPQLSLENCGKIQATSNSSYGSNSTMLEVVTINEGGKCINLPSLSVEQNYSQMLSELVMHI